ncbi:MAG TPA: hypothetical protein VFF28_02590 [Candidatus Nanoarchaeia archaeon]|nr:hypothetical protein [Candidatus Nanoarchaeia archaeon]
MFLKTEIWYNDTLRRRCILNDRYSKDLGVILDTHVFGLSLALHEVPNDESWKAPKEYPFFLGSYRLGIEQDNGCPISAAAYPESYASLFAVFPHDQ